jgi:hypothetical protein
MKSALGDFEQLASFAFLAFRLLNPLPNEPQRKEEKMKIEIMKSRLSRWALIATISAVAAGCAGGPLTSREKGAGIGALGGAAAGAAVGSAFHRPGMGAAIGAGAGLGAGALIGDYVQGQQER